MIRTGALRACAPLALIVASTLTLAGGCQLIAGLDDTGPPPTSSTGGAGGGSAGNGNAGGGQGGVAGSSSSSGVANGGGAPCADPPGTIVAVAAGAQHTCAIVDGPKGNTVYCWGDNSQFQLGLMTSGVGGPQPTVPTQLMFNPQIIAAGDTFTCASAGDTNVTCWGDADNIAMETAALSQSFPANVKTVIAGGNFACALLVDKDLYCWGYLTWDQAMADATRIASNIEAAAGGGGHLCYAIDDEVSCLGLNDHDECGEDPATDPVMVATTVTSGSEVFAGEDHTCARDTSSGLVCWGNDTDGEVNGAPAGNVQNASMTPWMDRFDYAALGAQHTCTTDGTRLDCWGSNQSDQIGSSSGQNKARHQLPPGFGFQGITAGGDHSCIWSKTTAQCWGGNSFGECGRVGSAPYDPTGAIRVCW